MTDGGMTRKEAMQKQTLTHRMDCGQGEKYDAKDVPACSPMCCKCLTKWLNKLDQ